MLDENENADDEDIGDSVLPVAIDEPAVPISLNALQPWHRPRKQFIREKQWSLLSERLIERLQNKQFPTIRAGNLNYLTLPGIDQFDIEILGELARRKGLRLTATGFLSEAEAYPIRARSQVRADTLIKRGLMEDTSVIYPYRFEEIAAVGSQAHKQVCSRAPFHIVNVDACGSIATPSALHSARIVDALHRLVEIQLTVMRDPWLLLLTTDARDNSLSDTVKNALEEAIRENARESPEFQSGAIRCFGDEGDDLESALQRASMESSRFVSKFSLGLSKWLLHGADGASWDLKSRQFYSYSTLPAGAEGASMACLAFEFHPRAVTIEDRFGAVEPMPPAPDNLADYSLMALRRATEMRNVDSLFNENDDLRRDFAQKQRSLLENAGYDQSALRRFDSEHLE